MPEALKRLINNISMLPGIWEKSATKLAFFLLNTPKNYSDNLIESIKDIKESINYCHICNAFTDKTKNICDICNSKTRDHYQICIIEEYLDMITIESSRIFKWVYHILGGAISPINGIFVWDLNLESLFERLENNNEKTELIIATNPNIEWEATAMYIKEEISKRWLNLNIKITRLSRWLSSGYLEYADNISIINSIKERKEM